MNVLLVAWTSKTDWQSQITPNTRRLKLSVWNKVFLADDEGQSIQKEDIVIWNIFFMQHVASTTQN